MSWLVGNWRLKLLAVGLSLVLLAAVGISENPPQITSIPVGVSYQNLRPELVLVDPPGSVKVTVGGLGDAIKQFSQTSVGASVDLSRAHAGVNQTYNARVIADTSNVSLQTPTVPVQLTIEPVATRQLDVDVRVTNVDSTHGISIVPSRTYTTCGNESQPCKVAVTAPLNVLNGLRAYVQFDARLSTAGTQFAPALPVKFERNGHPVDLATFRTQPEKVSFAPTVVTARVETQGGALTKEVAITTQVNGQPACGYRIDGLTFSPNPFATINGPTEVVARIGALSVDPISVAGATTSQTVSRILTAPSSSISVIDPPNRAVQVTVSITRAFSCTAVTPTPMPSVSPGTPSPSPTASPTA
jgi:hypothetical protein